MDKPLVCCGKCYTGLERYRHVAEVHARLKFTPAQLGVMFVAQATLGRCWPGVG